jgi:hypothetical protein
MCFFKDFSMSEQDDHQTGDCATLPSQSAPVSHCRCRDMEKQVHPVHCFMAQFPMHCYSKSMKCYKVSWRSHQAVQDV